MNQVQYEPNDRMWSSQVQFTLLFLIDSFERRDSVLPNNKLFGIQIRSSQQANESSANDTLSPRKRHGAIIENKSRVTASASKAI